MNIEAIIVTTIAAILSGLLGVIISNSYYHKQQKRNLKIYLLKNVLGFRFQLTPSYKGDTNEIISFLNQIVVIFNDSKQVMDLLEQYNDTYSLDDFVLLVKGMCNDMEIKYSEYGFNKEFFLHPFTFDEACRKQDL